jgi:hypothetical protein
MYNTIYFHKVTAFGQRAGLIKVICVEQCFSQMKQEGVLMYGVSYLMTEENRRLRRDFRRIAYYIMTGTV